MLASLHAAVMAQACAHFPRGPLRPDQLQLALPGGFV